MKYKHKSTVIEEVENKHFISERQMLAVRDSYESRSQSVDIFNIGTINCTNEGIGKVDFKAKSMVNLLHRSNSRYKCAIGYKTDGTHNTNSDYTITSSPDYINVKFGNITKGFSYIYFFIGGDRPGTVLMPGKKYTFFVDIYVSKKYPLRLYTSVRAGNSTDPMTDTATTQELKPGWNRIRTVMTCLDNGQFVSRDGKSIYIWISDHLKLSNMEINMKNAMLIEGDIPMSNYPGYFEGYISTMDSPSLITSHGSNYIDMNKLVPSNVTVLDVDPSAGYVKFKKKDNRNGSFIQFENILVEKYTDYSITYDVLSNGESSRMVTYVYKENSVYYDPWGMAFYHCPQFNTDDSNKVSIGLYVGPETTDKTFVVSNIRMTKGAERLPFEAYRENTLSIDALSLKELPNGVKDTLEGNKLTRRVGKIVLNGSEGWGTLIESVPSDSKTIAFVVNTSGKPWNMKHNNTYFSDTFMNYGSNCMYGSGDFEQIGSWSHGGSINIRINRNKSITDVNSFKNWLKNCPVTVYYELAEPTVEYVNLNRIGTYTGTTHIKTNSNFFIPMTVTTSQNVLENIDSMKHEVIEQSNKLSSIKNIQLAVLANLI